MTIRRALHPLLFSSSYDIKNVHIFIQVEAAAVPVWS